MQSLQSWSTQLLGPALRARCLLVQLHPPQRYLRLHLNFLAQSRPARLLGPALKARCRLLQLHLFHRHLKPQLRYPAQSRPAQLLGPALKTPCLYSLFAAAPHEQTNEIGLRDVLKIMGLEKAVRVVLSSHVGVAFAHNRYLFAPEAPLTRDLLVRLLNTLQARLP